MSSFPSQYEQTLLYFVEMQVFCDPLPLKYIQWVWVRCIQAWVLASKLMLRVLNADCILANQIEGMTVMGTTTPRAGRTTWQPLCGEVRQDELADDNVWSKISPYVTHKQTVPANFFAITMGKIPWSPLLYEWLNRPRQFFWPIPTQAAPLWGT